MSLFRVHFLRLATLALLTVLLPVGAVAQSAQRVDEPPSTESAEPVQATPSARSVVVPPKLTLERIMADPDWLGNTPEEPYWADDGASIYYFQKRPGEEARNLVQVDLQGRVLRTVAEGQSGAADAAGGLLSPDRQRKVYSHGGDLFVKELPRGPVRQLTRTAAREHSPLFMADGRRVSFQRNDTVFVRDLETGLEEQVTELKLEEDPDKKKEEPDYLRDQQVRLLDYIRTQKEKRDVARQREMEARRADPTRVPPPFYLGDEVEIRHASLSPNDRWMLVVLGKKEEDDGKADQMASWVTESGYVEVKDVRPKVGTGEGAGESLLLLDLVEHESYELSTEGLPTITEDPLADLRAAAEEREKQAAGDADAEGEIEEEELPVEEKRPEVEEEVLDAESRGTDEMETEEIEGEPGDVTPGDRTPAEGEDSGDGDDEDDESKPRSVNIRDVQWSEDGSRVVVMVFSVDNKDRWIATVDLPEAPTDPGRASAGANDDPTLVPVHHLRDEAWINWAFNEMGFLPGTRRLWLLSEESGYSHLYLADLASVEGIRLEALTEGEFLVENVAANREGSLLYFDANAEHPGIYDRYRVPVEGGPMERMTTLAGQTTAQLSPDGRNLLVTHSSATRPPELYVQANVPGAEASRLTETVSTEFLATAWVEPEFVAVPSTHVDRPIHSRLYRPQAMLGAMSTPSSAGGPAVVFVHGAGYLQNSHQGWSGYFREFMFHTFLTRAGYTVLDMDYRASRGYGRDWRTAIYRQMGTPELEDLQDGVAWLVANEGVDPERVGVYGGSYGGFMTFMALFKDPDLFAAGAALRPVTDWAHYNHPYTSNILNTPEIDPEAYARSSPIEFADGLAKPLLICAPMQDDNVFFQDTVRLVQRLIELEKENWEVAIYPVEAHGFREPSSWLDEYRRIFKLFEENVK